MLFKQRIIIRHFFCKKDKRFCHWKPTRTDPKRYQQMEWIYCNSHICIRDGLLFYHPQKICYPRIFRNISRSTWLSEESRNSATGNECISLKRVQAQMTHQTVHFARTIRSESSNELTSYLGSWPSTSDETTKHHVVYSSITAVNTLFAEDFSW